MHVELPSPPPAHITIHTSKLFDSRNKKFVRDTSITVDPTTGLVVTVFKRKSELEHIQASDIDLRNLTVLPGFIDAHTHIFLHAYSEASSLNQMRDESFVERIVRATNHCRAALLAGYTTYRDLGTEGLGSADVQIRDTINRGIIPGPRLFVATEAIASSGGYEIRQENTISGTTVPRISDPADGVDGVRAAVRRRLGAGADVIKFYADYRKRQLRFPPPGFSGAPPIQFPPAAAEQNPNVLLYAQEEMNAIVREAKVSGAPVAAHAQHPDGVVMAANAGVTSVEHGLELNDKGLKAMKDNKTIFVPTLSVMELYLPRGGPFEKLLANVKKAYVMGVKLACGGDTGGFNHGENAREMELMVEAGVPLLDVFQATTLHAWEACGGKLCGRDFGFLTEGAAADIVALAGDPEDDIAALRQVEFVMKDGHVWKRNGIATMN